MITLHVVISIVTGCISVLLLALVHPVWAWVPIGIIDTYYAITLASVKKKYNITAPIRTLPDSCNALLMQFGHYFYAPFGSKDCSSGAAIIQFIGVLVGIISLFLQFWWAPLFSVINWCLMHYIACSFTPIAFIDKYPQFITAHNLIFDMLNNVQNEPPEDIG